MEGLKRWGPVAVWAAVIFMLSSIPGSSFPKVAGTPGLDKLAHACIFGVLGLLLLRAQPGKRALWIAIVAAAAYGALDELHQLFTPGRDSSFWDFVADAIGAAAGAAAWMYYSHRQRHADHP